MRIDPEGPLVLLGALLGKWCVWLKPCGVPGCLAALTWLPTGSSTLVSCWKTSAKQTWICEEPCVSNFDKQDLQLKLKLQGPSFPYYLFTFLNWNLIFFFPSPIQAQRAKKHLCSRPLISKRKVITYLWAVWRDFFPHFLPMSCFFAVIASDILEHVSEIQSNAET